MMGSVQYELILSLIIPEFKKSSQKILARNQLEVADIDYYLPHQANTRIIERAANSLGFKAEQIITNIQQVGNTANASMILALDQFLKANPYYETSDDAYLYFFKVVEYRISDNVSPLEFVKDDVRNIILNKRKVELAKRLEDEVYNKALDQKEFEIIR